jgi:DNA-binding winged helix-turn-helix (wHTH) protein
MAEHQCLVFQPFLLDLRDERLWKGSETIRIGAKAFAVLRCLLTQAGHLVTKDTLLETVWPETVVGEAVLTVVIRELRQALGIRRISHSLSRPYVGGDIGLLPRSRW